MIINNNNDNNLKKIQMMKLSNHLVYLPLFLKYDVWNLIFGWKVAVGKSKSIQVCHPCYSHTYPKLTRHINDQNCLQ